MGIEQVREDPDSFEFVREFARRHIAEGDRKDWCPPCFLPSLLAQGGLVVKYFLQSPDSVYVEIELEGITFCSSISPDHAREWINKGAAH